MTAWQRVPAEPTTGMLFAGEDSSGLGYADLTRLYKAMLDAAPVPPANPSPAMLKAAPVPGREEEIARVFYEALGFDYSSRTIDGDGPYAAWATACKAARAVLALFAAQPASEDALAKAIKRQVEAEEMAREYRQFSIDYAVERDRAIASEDALAKMTAERDENRRLWLKAESEAYELKYAAAGGEDAPGSAHAVTVADVDRWRREAETALTTALAERDALREALEPFAKTVERVVLPGDTDDSRVVTSFTVRDLRRARTLATKEPSHEG